MTGPTPTVVTVQPAEPAQADAMAAAHAEIFGEGWSAADLVALLAQETTWAGVAIASGGEVAGLAIVQCVGGEAEILTLGVRPDFRRHGLGAELLAAALSAARARGASVMHLEVAQDNAAALALYRGHGFETTGRRPNYYVRGGGQRCDAVLMRTVLP